MYIEITKQAFDKLVSSDAKAVEVEHKEHCYKAHYFECGVNLIAVNIFVSAVWQYYIQDINA